MENTQEIKKIRKKLKAIERNRNIAFWLWLLYKLLDTGFKLCFCLGFLGGLLQIIGIQDISPFWVFMSSHRDFLMMGGIGGFLLTRRGNKWAKKMWERSTGEDTRVNKYEEGLKNQLKKLERTLTK